MFVLCFFVCIANLRGRALLSGTYDGRWSVPPSMPGIKKRTPKSIKKRTPKRDLTFALYNVIFIGKYNIVWMGCYEYDPTGKDTGIY